MVEKVLEINREKTIFWSLLGVIFLAAGLYIYFINKTIHNTVAMQNIEAESSSLTLKIGNKEFEYINKRNGITLSLAHSKGFKDAKVLAYLTKAQSRGVAIKDR